MLQNSVPVHGKEDEGGARLAGFSGVEGEIEERGCIPRRFSTILETTDSLLKLLFLGKLHPPSIFNYT